MKIWQLSAPRAAASATAVVSEPPRPSVVISWPVETPWKPATSTIFPSSSASWIRWARTSTIFAFVCVVSVTIPACEPVSEIASWPRSSIAISPSAQEMRSPTEISMSIARGFGRSEIAVGEVDELVGRVAHRREDGDDATAFLLRGDDPPRDAWSRSGLPTEVPPNFITTVPTRCSSAGAISGTAS